MGCSRDAGLAQVPYMAVSRSVYEYAVIHTAMTIRVQRSEFANKRSLSEENTHIAGSGVGIAMIA
jgi:hypothetical protein